MSRKMNNGKKLSAGSVKGKNVKAPVVRIDNFCRQTVALCKSTLMLFAALYMIGGTLAMGIVYHQHQGHLFSWLAGDESLARKQATLEQRKAAEMAELEADCQASYHMSCTGYALSIAEATQSSGKRDTKQIAMLEKAKNKARVAM